MKCVVITPGEQGFALRVELWDGKDLVHILETDNQQEAFRFAQTHFPFQIQEDQD